MDISASQCSSSGCESGWTMYLDQSSLSKNQYQGFGGFPGGGYGSVEDEEEEDLSMVSDASSGPPHYCCEDEEESSFYRFNKKGNIKKKSKEHGRTSQQLSCLDDTASSAVLSKARMKLQWIVSGNVPKVSLEHISRVNLHSKSTLASFRLLFLKNQVPKEQVVFKEENGNDKQ
ncbi:hypothetical protein Tsubulata_027201 [Turnera subulata]|uniref:Uncharacterized protein n=1 Tax=Turnera subulata TaxID=218843 RepID=A0A9Q0G403_9ROSI|nr:hypothetical protein Tsubulata_027201 [Turnera subulata]